MRKVGCWVFRVVFLALLTHTHPVTSREAPTAIEQVAFLLEMGAEYPKPCFPENTPIRVEFLTWEHPQQTSGDKFLTLRNPLLRAPGCCFYCQAACTSWRHCPAPCSPPKKMQGACSSHKHPNHNEQEPAGPRHSKGLCWPQPRAGTGTRLSFPSPTGTSRGQPPTTDISTQQLCPPRGAPAWDGFAPAEPSPSAPANCKHIPEGHCHSQPQ